MDHDGPDQSTAAATSGPDPGQLRGVLLAAGVPADKIDERTLALLTADSHAASAIEGWIGDVVAYYVGAMVRGTPLAAWDRGPKQVARGPFRREWEALELLRTTEGQPPYVARASFRGYLIGHLRAAEVETDGVTRAVITELADGEHGARHAQVVGGWIARARARGVR